MDSLVTQVQKCDRVTFIRVVKPQEASDPCAQAAAHTASSICAPAVRTDCEPLHEYRVSTASQIRFHRLQSCLQCAVKCQTLRQVNAPSCRYACFRSHRAAPVVSPPHHPWRYGNPGRCRGLEVQGTPTIRKPCHRSGVGQGSSPNQIPLP